MATAASVYVVVVGVAVEFLPATFLHSICTNLIVCRLWQQLADSVALFHYFIYIFIYSVCLFALSCYCCYFDYLLLLLLLLLLALVNV